VIYFALERFNNKNLMKTTTKTVKKQLDIIIIIDFFL